MLKHFLNISSKTIFFTFSSSFPATSTTHRPTGLLNSIGMQSDPKYCNKSLPQINPQLNLLNFYLFNLKVIKKINKSALVLSYFF